MEKWILDSTRLVYNQLAEGVGYAPILSTGNNGCKGGFAPSLPF